MSDRPSVQNGQWVAFFVVMHGGYDCRCFPSGLLTARDNARSFGPIWTDGHPASIDSLTLEALGRCRGAQVRSLQPWDPPTPRQQAPKGAPVITRAISR